MALTVGPRSFIKDFVSSNESATGPSEPRPGPAGLVGPTGDEVVLYGATGYTGRLVALELLRRGITPLLAGRSAEAVAAVGAELGAPTAVFSLQDVTAAAAALRGAGVVLNAAGPFHRTAGPLAAAAVAAGVAYLDLAGEVADLEAVLEHDGAARERGVLLMPAVGFGVVPTDCLALRVVRALPGATRLTLAFDAEGGVSRGTLATLLHHLPRPGIAVEEGRVRPAWAGERSRAVDFGAGAGRRKAISNPWRADLVTAPRSTGVGTVETYTVFPGVLRLLAGTATGRWSVGRSPLGALLRWLVTRLPAGPDAAAREAGATRVRAEAEDGAGHRRTALLRGPEAYRFTALTAALVVEKVLAGETPSGFRTPAELYGPGLVEEVPGVEIEDPV